MGNNQAWLTVKATSLDDTEAAVIESYQARGARLVGRHYDASLPERWELPDGAVPAVLGVALHASSERGWTLVSDSLRYTADATLAADLAARLDTSVFRYVIADIVSFLSIERFGRESELPGLIDLDEYRREDEPDTRFLVFEDVAGYDEDPHVVLDTPCPLCGLRWHPGGSVRSWPDRLVSLHPKRSRPARPRVLFRWNCGTMVDVDERCTGEGWATGVIDQGLLGELCALPDAAFAAGLPDDLDVVLEAQREVPEIEELLARLRHGE